MYRVAKTLLRSDADCADAIQEAIVKAFTGIQTLRKDSYAKTWLVRIVINECYAIMRHERRLVPIDDFTVAEAAAEQADYSELYDALSRLPEEIRLAVTLYYIEGYSVREVAELLNTTQSGVKNRLMRARAKMKKDLAEAE